MGGVSYRDVRELPTDIYAMWMMFRAGEGRARREQRERERSKNSTRYV